MKYGPQGANPMCSGSLSEGTSAARSPPGSCLSWLPCLAWDSQGLGAEASRLETLRLQVAKCCAKSKYFDHGTRTPKGGHCGSADMR